MKDHQQMSEETNNLYGTTWQGGISNSRTVFKVTTSGAFISLFSLSGSNGRKPQAGLVLGADDNFYGTTSQGGRSDMGTVFRVIG